MSKNILEHVVYECKYHIVLVPKYRYKIFEKEVKVAIRDEIKKLCIWMKIEIIEVNICKDRIHVCCSIPPKCSISEVIGTIKGKSAIRIFKKFPELKKQYWGSHFWSRGYFVSTVGLNEDKIKNYIKDQDKRDRLENQGKLFKFATEKIAPF